jgi:phosphoribosylanthranilate isomerase
MKSPSVKVCGITQAKDARFACKSGASKFGFILYSKSPRRVTLNKVEKIKKEAELSLDKMVAVEVEPDIEYLKIIEAFGFGYYQLHFSFDFPRENIEQWSKLIGVEKLWLAPKLPKGVAFPEDILPYANTFLVDAYAEEKFGGTGKRSDWEGFSKWQKKYSSKNWVLAGGLSTENIRKALSMTQSNMIDVNSGIEKSPGIKDLDKMREFFSKIS